MPAPRKHKSTKSFLFGAEADNLEVIKEIAHTERMSTADKLNELIALEIERKKVNATTARN